MVNSPDIIFPGMGITIDNLDAIAFNIFGIDIYWYGLIIACGVMSGLYLAMREAKRTGQDPNDYIDFIIIAMITSMIGARLYYVILSWDQYKDNLWQIFNFRQGGLAIYGAIIASVITLYFFTKRKKLKFTLMADTAVLGLILGQVIGRWGNFVNREAFGGYTDSFTAMMIKVSDAKYIPSELIGNIDVINGIEYISVHPTFLYESLWNLVLLICLLLYRKRKKFEGEVFALYVVGYGIGRFFIEGMRTDQLIIGSTGIAISQVVAILSAIAAVVFIVINRKKAKQV